MPVDDNSAITATRLCMSVKRLWMITLLHHLQDYICQLRTGDDNTATTATRLCISVRSLLMITLLQAYVCQLKDCG